MENKELWVTGGDVNRTSKINLGFDDGIYIPPSNQFGETEVRMDDFSYYNVKCGILRLLWEDFNSKNSWGDDNLITMFDNYLKSYVSFDYSIVDFEKDKNAIRFTIVIPESNGPRTLKFDILNSIHVQENV